MMEGTNMKRFHYSILLVLCITLVIPAAVFAASDTLILYYSRTGYTKLISETIAKGMSADILEIKEVGTDRAGTWGFITAGIAAFFDQRGEITPAVINLSGYKNIIIASPIWSWNLATPIHSLLLKNHFKDQKIVLVTVANIDIQKYAPYTEGKGNAVKRFLKGYLDGKKMKARDEVARTLNQFSQFKGHVHFAVEKKTLDQLAVEAQTRVEEIKADFSS
jgi:menaquinone-dependent protoporphyrinogen IX oxidase